MSLISLLWQWSIAHCLKVNQYDHKMDKCMLHYNEEAWTKNIGSYKSFSKKIESMVNFELFKITDIDRNFTHQEWIYYVDTR